jgi:hypothetical protein
MSRGKKAFITSLALMGLSVFLCASPVTAAMTVSSAAVGSADNLAPGPVGTVTAALDIVTGNSVNVAWTLAADDFGRQAPVGSDFTSDGVFVNVNDVAGYNVWRQVIGTTDPVLVGSAGAGATSFVDDTVITGETYIYLVTVADGAGNESSAVESDQVNLGPPPTLAVEVSVGYEEVKVVTLTFDAVLDLEDEVAVDDFKTDFIAELAILLEIDPSLITIIGIVEGSVIVSFEIAGPDAAAAVSELEAELEADPTVLSSGPVLSSAAFSSGSLDLGVADIDEELIDTFTFLNNPDDPNAVLVVTAEIAGTGFSVDVASLSLAAGESDGIDVIFTAGAVGNLNGDYAGELVLTTNDPNNRTTVVALTASIEDGLDVGDISISGAFNFASIAIGTTKSLDLTLTNVGDLLITGEIALSGNAAFTAVGSDEDGNVVSLTQVPFTLAGGEEIDIGVAFAPLLAESYAGTITITSDDVDEPTLTVDLSGAGFDPGEISILVDADGNTIVGDFDASATVNFDDFFIFADNFGQAVFTPATDLDASGAVNFDDFFIFADNFGKTGTYVGG